MSQGALAGAGAGVGAGAGWITITAPGVVVVVSLIMPPPSTLPEEVTRWFGPSGPTMRATQSARSFCGRALQRSVALATGEPLLSSLPFFFWSRAAPASFRQVALSWVVLPASHLAFSLR